MPSAAGIAFHARAATTATGRIAAKCGLMISRPRIAPPRHGRFASSCSPANMIAPVRKPFWPIIPLNAAAGLARAGSFALRLAHR